MYRATAIGTLLLAGLTYGQQAGTLIAESHPAISWYKCSVSSNCAAQSGKIVLDANWRWYHSKSGTTNCYTANQWNAALCPDAATCLAGCVVEGVNYSTDFGITTTTNSIRMKWQAGSTGPTTGSRVFLMQDDSTYLLFKPLAMEIAVDVDLSTVPCGMAATLQLSEMAADGGAAAYGGAGAKYGTGYCDASCPKDVKWVNGEVNNIGWTPTTATSGTGNFGACCSEVDLFQGNTISSDFAGHSCAPTYIGSYKCQGGTCSTLSSPNAGVCDPLGCEFNSYRNGATAFYGPGKTIDTSQKFTVVTQFITDTGGSGGTLKEIRRLWMQNNVIIQNVVVNIGSVTGAASVTAAYCAAKETAFGDANSFEVHGGFSSLSAALSRGMVLSLSIKDDPTSNSHLAWLDGTYPPSSTAAGAVRGTCPASSGTLEDLQVVGASSSVTFSNIRIGPIGTTTTVPHYGQCGGIGYL